MFIEALVEKHEDKYEKFKYAILLKNIIEHVDNFDFLLPRLEKHDCNRVIKTELLGCVHSYLKIHLPVKQGSNLYEKEGAPPDNIKLSASFLLSLKKYIADHPIASFISDIRTTFFTQAWNSSTSSK